MAQQVIKLITRGRSRKQQLALLYSFLVMFNNNIIYQYALACQSRRNKMPRFRRKPFGQAYISFMCLRLIFQMNSLHRITLNVPPASIIVMDHRSQPLVQYFLWLFCGCKACFQTLQYGEIVHARRLLIINKNTKSGDFWFPLTPYSKHIAISQTHRPHI